MEIQIGMKFDCLTVLEFAGDAGNKQWWNCRCTCGQKRTVQEEKLKTGLVKTCGFHPKDEKFKAPPATPSFVKAIEQRFEKYASSAAMRKYEFQLTLDQFNKLTQQNCNYCGGRSENGECGIDRVENDQGYLIENVVPCCSFCNFAKGKRTIAEFKEWSKRLYHNLHRKNFNEISNNEFNA